MHQRRASLGPCGRSTNSEPAIDTGPKTPNRRQPREKEMIELSRRRVLTAASATLGTALTPFAPSHSRAAAPPVGSQAPGWYRYKVGDIEVTVVTDGVNKFK